MSIEVHPFIIGLINSMNEPTQRSDDIQPENLEEASFPSSQFKNITAYTVSQKILVLIKQHMAGYYVVRGLDNFAEDDPDKPLYLVSKEDKEWAYFKTVRKRNQKMSCVWSYRGIQECERWANDVEQGNFPSIEKARNSAQALYGDP